MPRHFRVPDGRTVTLPQGLQAGPGATNMRLDPGAVVTLDDAACNGEHSRFIAGRLRAGDLEEIESHMLPKESTPHKYVGHPDRPSGKPSMIETGNFNAPKKEG